ncbi:MAG TPA: alpha/beta hydrolase [Candidatus Limnocylindria bacterium]|nr:alpha/beta hydrolase [Candidatus Limnocylindria bacterium]
MTLDAWRAGGRTFAYRGHPVFYRDQGAGPVVLCVHGFPTASFDWHRLWGRLVARWRAIAPDMLGFGFSAKPRPYPYSIMDQAALHEALLAALGVDRVVVLAHDYGDTVAQELLARFAERRAAGTPGLALRGVCFLNGGLFPEAHRARFIQRLLASPLGPLLSRLANEASFRASFAAVFGAHTQPTAAELHDFWTLVRHDHGERIGHLLIRYMDERRRHRERWVGALTTATVPLRLVDGADDPVSGRHMAERYREIVPAPDVVVLDGIGHYPQIEDPDGVWQAFEAFAARLVP